MKPLTWPLRLLLFLSFAIASAEQPSATPDEHRLDTRLLKDGDMVFIRSHSRNAKAISKVTQSAFTHCGIVFNEGGVWKVREGAGMGTRYLDINKWQDKESTDYQTDKIEKYEPITVRRLSEAKTWPAQERPEKLQKLRDEARKLHETMYDFGFAWDNHYIIHHDTDEFSTDPNAKEYVYCSELIYKAFKRALAIQLTDLKKIKDYPLDDEAREILNNPRGKKDRGDKEYSSEETVIAPQDIYESKLLEDVIDGTP